MSHDALAAHAATELARICRDSPTEWFAPLPAANHDAFASRDPLRFWPYADGAISVQIGPTNRLVALEFKRVNEGVHGILTALGQAHAYLHKGFAGAAVVIPQRYESLAEPGVYVRDMLNSQSPNMPIGVFTYGTPDMSLPNPFENRLVCTRRIALNPNAATPSGPAATAPRPNTQWAHVREGSTTPDVFYRYLSEAKLHSGQPATTANVNHIRSQLVRAVRAISNVSPEKYLACAPGDSFADQVWRRFWFRWVVTVEMQQVFRQRQGQYFTVDSPTQLRQWDGTPSTFFSGRSDSIKDVLVAQLNAGTLGEPEAWIEFAKKVRNRAHSLREDVDSGLEAMGFVDSDGRLTLRGYAYAEACDRTGSPNTELPVSILRRAALTEGDYLAFLHYVYSLTDKLMSDDPSSFSRRDARGRLSLDQDAYRDWLRTELATRLKVMNTAVARGGTTRKPFQAELTLLRKLGLVGGFRPGVGLVIHWPRIYESLENSARVD